MNGVDPNGAKANLESYAQGCQESPVMVTIGCADVRKLVPIRDDDPDFIDRLLETKEDFRRVCEASKRGADEGRIVRLAEVRRLLGPE